ncbi:hypothetical protein QBC35DRAFT_94009 [Podospora australis]|uniref:Uncharacterized protein n=1 Tax=Podospora australis TaxID=1536484 RepID=A0AAN6WXU5_9PEZI|nr:hypothetical protein QBC35DRAFT_94009 [Podospora australis]
MATTSRQLRPNVDFEIHVDHRNTAHKNVRGNHLNFSNRFSALQESLPLTNIQNIQNSNPTIDSLSRDLDNFHLHSSIKEQNHNPFPKPERRVRLSVDNNTECEQQDFACNSKSRKSSGTSIAGSENFDHNNALAVAHQHLPSSLEQYKKHEEGQFEWLLTIPVSKLSSASNKGSHDDTSSVSHGEKKLLFGCNLMHHRSQSAGALGNDGKPANVYTLLATRIESEEESVMTDTPIVLEEAESTIANASNDNSIVLETTSESQHVTDGPSTTAMDHMQRRSESAMSHVSTEYHLTVSPQPPRPLSRIEDSVEELDKLEEELEAMEEVAQLDRVVSLEPVDPSPAPVEEPTPRPASALTRTGYSGTRPPSTVSGTLRIRSHLERRSSTRVSRASEDDDSRTTVNASTRPVSTLNKPTASSTVRKSAPRPTSLLPPKAMAKSSRPTSVPAFELPGEAIARRLKEQRAARLSQHATPEQAAAVAAQFSPSKPHVKSTKPPTKPAFELPGEAISRRRREEREARLRAQEEEERKRREFKAKPIRAGIAAASPGSFPRETVTSRQRRMEAAAAANGSSGASTTAGSGLPAAATAAARKRHSIAVGSLSTSAHLSSSTAASRGRTSMAPASAGSASSRGTSTTSGGTGGASGAPANRGKEIFARDNSYTAEREREKKERELAAKLARQEAAERSRALSREWKEKMNRKRASMMASITTTTSAR